MRSSAWFIKSGGGRLESAGEDKSLYAVKSEPERLAMANSHLSSELNDQRVLAGPVRTMGLALDRIEEESRALQQALSLVQRSSSWIRRL